MYGYHAVYEGDFASAIRLGRKHGFDYVQFDLGVPEFYITELSHDRIREIARISDAEGVQVTFHAPGDFLAIGIDTHGVRGAILDHYTRILYVAQQLNARHVTFHVGGVPLFRAASDGTEDFQWSHEPYYREILEQDLRHIDQQAGSVLVAIENHRFGRLHFRALTNVLSDSNRIRLCADLPKLYSTDTKIDLADMAFMTAMRSRIAELHVHNRSGTLHRPVDQGTIDLTQFADWIEDESIWKTIEVRPVDQAAASLRWMRSTFGAG